MKQLILTLPILLLLTGCSSTVTDEDRQTVQTNDQETLKNLTNKLTGVWIPIAETTDEDINYLDYLNQSLHNSWV